MNRHCFLQLRMNTMQLQRRLSALAFILLVPGGAFGADVGEQFTRFGGLELGSGTLLSIQGITGSSLVTKTGEGSESIASICLRLNGGYVAFLAGVLDGPDRLLGGFWLSTDAMLPPCPRATESFSATRLEAGGLTLGMTVEDFLSVVGVPVTVQDGWHHAHFHGRRRLTELELERLPLDVQQGIARGDVQDFGDVDVTVSVRFRHGAATDIRVWKGETY